MTDPLRRALVETIGGLIEIIPDDDGDQHATAEVRFPHLRWMLQTCLANMQQPVDKTCRWIGYVQGVLACRGILDVNAERKRTRPLFHAAYAEMELEIPPTRDPD